MISEVSLRKYLWRKILEKYMQTKIWVPVTAHSGAFKDAVVDALNKITPKWI